MTTDGGPHDPHGPGGHRGPHGPGGSDGPDGFCGGESPDSYMINAKSAQSTRSSLYFHW